MNKSLVFVTFACFTASNCVDRRKFPDLSCAEIAKQNNNNCSTYSAGNIQNKFTITRNNDILRSIFYQEFAERKAEYKSDRSANDRYCKIFYYVKLSDSVVCNSNSFHNADFTEFLAHCKVDCKMKNNHRNQNKTYADNQNNGRYEHIHNVHPLDSRIVDIHNRLQIKIIKLIHKFRIVSINSNRIHDVCLLTAKQLKVVFTYQKTSHPHHRRTKKSILYIPL